MSTYPYNLPEDHPDRLMELDYQQQKEDEERARTEPGYYESKSKLKRLATELGMRLKRY